MASGPVTVCIAGMHRSGTSMVTRALSTCGVGLGPPDRLMQAQADNPEGFAENIDFVRLNDALLDRLGAAWDSVDELSQDAAALDDLLPAGAALIDAVAASATGCAAWAWKDPRNCLTLPFWRRLLPGLKVLVCVRHPLAVAQSLHQRNRHSLRFGLRLWTAYARHLLAALPGQGVVVTHYDAWLHDARAELSRTLSALGLAADASAVLAAASAVEGGRRDHAAPAAELLAAQGGLDTLALYDHLRSRAGPVYRASADDADALGKAAVEPWVMRRGDVDPRQHELVELRARYRAVVTALSEREPSHRYRLGDTIDARLGGNAPLFLLSGWAPPQAAGTWTVGSAAGIRLRLTDRCTAPLRLRMRLRPLLAPGQPALPLTIVVDRSPVHEAMLDAPRMTELDLVLPAAPTGELDIELRLAAARSPRELGLSQDTRRLGVLLHSLRLTLREADSTPDRAAGSRPED